MHKTNHPVKLLSLASAFTLIVLLCQLLAGPLIGKESLPCFALTSIEDQILTKWKQTAATSTLGLALLQVLNDCNHAVAINSLNSKAYFRRGYLYGIVGCTYSAINDLGRAIAISPYESKGYTERGLCYMDLKQYQAALTDLNRAVQLDPRSGNALLARARLRLLTGRPEVAIGDLSFCQSPDVKFAAELPGEYNANQFNAVSYYLGASWEALARPDKAISYYKNSLKTTDQMTLGYLHRYADQPIDTKLRIAKIEHTSGGH